MKAKRTSHRGKRRGLNRCRRAILLGPMVTADAELLRTLADLNIDQADFLVGVDAGAETWLKLGIEPDLAVGDWDSLKHREVLEFLPHLSLPIDKERSDLHYTTQAAVNAGATELACLGFTGGRPDHQLAVLFDLMEALETLPLEKVTLVGPDARYGFVTSRNPRAGEWSERLPKNQIVSVFALRERAEGVTLKGLKYPLENATLDPSSRGLSNKVFGSKVSVKVKRGSLLVVILDER